MKTTKFGQPCLGLFVLTGAMVVVIVNGDKTVK